MMLKSEGAKEEVEKLSEKLEDSLITLCSLMAKVVSTWLSRNEDENPRDNL